MKNIFYRTPYVQQCYSKVDGKIFILQPTFQRFQIGLRHHHCWWVVAGFIYLKIEDDFIIHTFSHVLILNMYGQTHFK